jgi:uncharacterized damage-inducible protein DinB
MKIIQKPKETEFQKNEPDFSKLIPNDGLLLQHLTSNFQKTKTFIFNIPISKLEYRYAPNKWTIKEIMVHLIDMERIYAYRMLRFARNDQAILADFNDEHYVKFSGANHKNIADLIDELETVRNATISLLNGFDNNALLRFGLRNGIKVSVRALAYHIAGHELHHINVIKESYLD